MENHTVNEICDYSMLVADPVVSVNMITYNHQKYLSKAIESVVSQITNFPFELIIGEDCSTDNTREIALFYQKKFPRIIRVMAFDNNIGMLKNLLMTERESRGKYIAYCEGDDYWHNPNKLQMQIELLEKNQDYGLVHGDIDKLDQNSGIIKKAVNNLHLNDYYKLNNQFYGILLGEYTISTCTVCTRTDLIREVTQFEYDLLTNPKVKQGDLSRWLYISHKSMIKFIPESLATYRILSESASHSRIKKNNLKFSESSKQVRRYFAHKYKCPQEVKKIVDLNYYKCILNASYHNCDSIKAKSSFRKIKEHEGVTFIHILYLWGACSRLMKSVSLPFLWIRRFMFALNRINRL